MNAEAGPREHARKPRPNPQWIDRLPKKPSRHNMGMEFVSFAQNPNKRDFIRITKPGTRIRKRSTAPEEIETAEEIKVFQEDLIAAQNWLDNAHRYIDKHDGERNSSDVDDLLTLSTQVMDVMIRLSTVLAFGGEHFDPQPAQPQP